MSDAVAGRADVDRADDAAWAWVEHVRAGGTVPWVAWRAESPRAAAAGRTGTLPGAAQLEVVRRLGLLWTEQGRPASVRFPVLADRVLARSGPGRGLGDLPLDVSRVSGDGSPPPHGPRAVDPAEVPAEELLRITVGVLADLVARTPLPSTAFAAERTPRRRPWHRPFRLVGAPVEAAALRRSLAAQGHVEGGRRPTVVILAGSPDDMMRQEWAARLHRGGEAPWARLWVRSARRGSLPNRIDLPRLAESWADRVGADRVHVLVDPEAEARSRVVTDLVGVRPPVALDTGLCVVPPADRDGLDLLRRLNAVHSIRLPADQAQRLRERVLPGLLGSGEGGLRAPDRFAQWSRECAHDLRDRLAAGGYAVHGNLDDLVPRHDAATPGRPVRSRVLDRALRACLRAAEA